MISKLEGSLKRRFLGLTRLKPGPDSVEGLTRLKKKYVIAPVSNGNIALMTSLAKFGGLPWDAILFAEMARHYKPDREVYVSAYYSTKTVPHKHAAAS